MSRVAPVFKRINAFAERRPVLVSVTVTAGKAYLADLLIQTQVEGRRLSDVDLRRSALFFSFGGIYQGGWQFFMYNHVLERLFPQAKLAHTIGKIAAANFICDPVFFFPTFYTFREFAFAEDRSRLTLSTAVDTALSKYRENFLRDWRNSWLIWFPGYGVAFAFVPTHLRMPWIAAVSFGYVCILSFTRGAQDEE